MKIFKKKTKPILYDEDIIELKEIERKSYMEEARKLASLRGVHRANQELAIKQKKEEF